MSTRVRPAALPALLDRALEPVLAPHLLALCGVSIVWLAWVVGLAVGPTPWGAIMTAGTLWAVVSAVDRLAQVGALSGRVSALLRAGALGTWLVATPAAVAEPLSGLGVAASIVIVSLAAHRLAAFLAPAPRPLANRVIRADLRLAAGLAGCLVFGAAFVILCGWQLGYTLGPGFLVDAMVAGIVCLAPSVVTVRMVLRDGR